MIKCYLKITKTLPEGKKLELSDVVGYLQAVTYRELLDNNTADIHFEYVILNVGGVEYDLSKCKLAKLICPDGSAYELAYSGGNITCNGNIMHPNAFVQKFYSEIF